MARSFAVQLAEIFELSHGQLVAAQVQQGINQHRAVTVGQDKTVAVGPVWVQGVVLQVLAPQSDGHIGHAHGGPGVAGVRLLYCVHRKRAYRACHLLGVGHGNTPGGARWVLRQVLASEKIF